MEIVKISSQILDMNEQLFKMRSEIKNRALQKSKTIAEYDKALGKTMLSLRNGVEMSLDEETIKDPPTTIIEKISKAIVWKERLAMEEADLLYKSLITNIETVKAQLNGLQSINRHLDS